MFYFGIIQIAANFDACNCETYSITNFLTWIQVFNFIYNFSNQIL